MKKVIELTKIFLKNSFSEINMKMGISTKGKNKVLPKILFLLLFLYLGGIVIFFSYGIIETLKVVHQEKMFIGMILLAIIGVTTIQTIFSSINNLYFTKDSEYILPLPLKPEQIILARTNVLLIMEYMIEALIGLVPLVLYGILTGMGILYYITMAITLIALPVLPVLLVSTIVMIVMSFAKLTKNKNRFQLIATAIVIVLVIALSLSISNIDEDMTTEQITQILLQANGMVDLIKGYFPTMNYLITALTSSSILTVVIELLKAIGITAAGFILYILIAKKIYFRGLVGNLFGGNNRKTKIKLEEKQFKNNKLYKSYIAKEFKTLVRNPIFLLQCLLPAILMPVLILGMLFMQFSNINNSEFQAMLNSIQTDSLMVSGIILGIMQFFAMFIYISITAISRDGKNAVFIKYVPVSLYKQYIYKIIPNLIMNIVTAIVTLVIVEIIFKLSILTLVLLFIVSTIISIVQSLLMIIIDLKRPKLEWDSEYSVVKQNFNLIFPVLLSMFNIAIIIVDIILFGSFSTYIGLFVLAIVFGVLAYVINRYLVKNQKVLADRII